MEIKKSTLYAISAPIGENPNFKSKIESSLSSEYKNLNEYTVLAINLLKKIDVVFAEKSGGDITRTLEENNIISSNHKIYTTPHRVSELNKITPLIDELIEKGEDFILLSDSGIPCFIDPGTLIIQYILLNHPNKINIIPIGVSSALDGALAISGIYFNNFFFAGHYPEQHRIPFDINNIDFPILAYIKKNNLKNYITMINEKIKNKKEYIIYLFEDIGKPRYEFKMSLLENIMDEIYDNNNTVIVIYPHENILKSSDRIHEDRSLIRAIGKKLENKEI